MFDPPPRFPGFLMSWCLVFLGPQPRGRFSPHGLCSSFYSFFVSFFQTSFLTAIKPKSSQNGSSQTTKNHKKLKKKVTETHPQSGPVKRLSLAGAKPLKLTTLTTLSAVFPKGQSSQSWANMEAKMGSLGTQNHKKSKTPAPPKTLQNKPTKSWTRSPFWYQKRSTLSLFFGPLLEPRAVLGPQWSPSLPREPRAWSQTLFSMIFDGFWIDFWLLFAFGHLSAITFFAVVFGFLFGWFLSSPACLPPPTSKARWRVMRAAHLDIYTYIYSYLWLYATSTF